MPPRAPLSDVTTAVLSRRSAPQSPTISRLGTELLDLFMEEAVTLGVGITTVGQGLYQFLGPPWPTTLTIEPSSSILIYGGSTATGTLAIQFAKISGLRPRRSCGKQIMSLTTARSMSAQRSVRPSTRDRRSSQPIRNI